MLESFENPVYLRYPSKYAPNCEPPLELGGITAPRRRVPTRGAGMRTARRSPHSGRSPGSSGVRAVAGAELRRSGEARGDQHSGPVRPGGVAVPAAPGDAVAQFAERSLRLILEVVDGRRPLGQLRAVAEPTVLAAVDTLARTAARERRLGTATLVSVRTSWTGDGAEVFAGYERGPRRFAIAARLVEQRGRWRVSAVRMR